MLQEEGSSPFVKVMDQQEKQESHDSPTPVLPRLDRLDRLLQLLEEKHNLSSGRQICKISDNYDELKEKDEYHLLKKTLASALEEVQHKGTLMERIATLETRVLQLSLAIDEGNTSKSSSSTVELKDKHEDTKVVDGHGRKSPLGVQGQENGITRDTDTTTRAQLNGGKQSKKAHKRWLRWFNPTCSMSNKWNQPLD